MAEGSRRFPPPWRAEKSLKPSSKRATLTRNSSSPKRKSARERHEALLAALHAYAERADTSYILVAATALERLLEQALLSKMRELSNGRYTDLFTGHGPLATFSAKIEICYALGIISDELVADFHAIRGIRNAFAHADAVLNFNSRQLDRLKGWGDRADRRALFDKRILACTEALDRFTDAALFAQALQGRTDELSSRRRPGRGAR
jgi:hypothetical protein